MFRTRSLEIVHCIPRMARAILPLVIVLCSCSDSVTGTRNHGPPANLSLISGNAQQDTIDAVLALPLTVSVTDASARPVPGVTVTFSTAQGGATIASSISDSLGHAAATVSLGDSAGTYTVMATAMGLQGSPVIFTATATIPLFHATSVVMGQEFTCAISPTQQVSCWGANDGGQLGDGTTVAYRLLPAPVVGSLHFTQISASGSFACGIADVAYCWGSNNLSSLGDGTTVTRRLPTPVIGGDAFTYISAGGDHACALTKAGDAFCWGISQLGAVGDGTNANTRLSPVAVVGGLKFTKIASGARHTCGLVASGAMYCWGWNVDGALGDGTTTTRYAPTAVSGGLTFASLAAGADDTCGLTPNGVAYCWGANDRGKLGTADTVAKLTPTAVQGGYTFAQLAAGYDVTCGITTIGALYCWGDPLASGGAPSNQPIVAPRPVNAPGGMAFTSVTVGDTGGCAIATTAATYCWGDNVFGEIGDGTRMFEYAAVPVHAR